MRKAGLIDFPMWRFWPILFMSAGLAFLALWAFRESKSWVFFPGGLLLLAAGAGLAEESWWRYQRWLRDVVDMWPLLLIAFGVVLLIGYWRRGADKSGVDG